MYKPAAELRINLANPYQCAFPIPPITRALNTIKNISELDLRLVLQSGSESPPVEESERMLVHLEKNAKYIGWCYAMERAKWGSDLSWFQR